MKWRYIAILIFFASSFFAIILKLGYWQFAQAEELVRLGNAQYSKELSIQPLRGEVRTSDDFPLATNKLIYTVFANPRLINDPQYEADKLAPLLQVDSATISALLSTDKFWVSLASNIDIDKKQEVTDLNLAGIGFEEKYGRMYPEASMAAELLGFVGKDENGNDKGYFGLEGYYDRQLRGRPGEGVLIQDANGKPVLTKQNGDSGKQDGRTLILHIDRVVQYLVEQKLLKGIETYGAESGMAAVMDPKDGGVIAMASFPGFDPRSFRDYDTSLYKNPFITDTYEPGSTFKPLVMSAALNERLVTPSTTCPICDGPVEVGGYDLHTWNDKYYPNTNMIDVIMHSDNTGMVFVAQKLGLSKMIDYLQKFGIDDSTGIDLQGELAPGLKPRDNWYAIDLATAGFGQGLAVTPIELLDAFASIANKGRRMEPHVVDKIITPDGQTIAIQPKVLSTPISTETAEVMTAMLVNAVNKGEASFARLKGYDIGGKTGTASIPVNGHYDPTKTIASFIGFAPADDPRFVMLVILNKPTASIYGAETAAPIFFDIARDLLQYYGVAPTGND